MSDEENLPKGNIIRKRRELPDKPPFGQIFPYSEGQGEPPFEPNFDEDFVEYEADISEDELEDYLAEGFYVDDSEDIEEIYAHEEMREIRKNAIEQRQGKSLIDDENAINLQKQNLQSARDTEIKEIKREHIKSIFSAFLYIVLFSGILASAVLGFMYYKGYIFNDSSRDNMTLEELDELDYWKLEKSPLNDLLKDFYADMASFELISKAQGDYIKGNLTFKDKAYSYWLNKNRQGNAYLKLENRAEEIGYYLPAFALARQLFETKISGKGENLSAVDTESLRAVFLYDEYFWNYAFPTQRDIVVDLNLLANESIGAKDYIKLEASLKNKIVYFYFDLDTKVLSFIKYNYDGADFEIRFSSYKRFDDGFKFPTQREIYVNSDLKIKANSTLISRKKGKIVFPH